MYRLLVNSLITVGMIGASLPATAVEIGHLFHSDKTNHPTSTPPSNNTSAPKAQKVQMVIIYENPAKDAKIMRQVEPSHRLVPIFTQGDWIKVGDAKDGQTGWINQPQYQQAMQSRQALQNSVQPYTQAIFVNTQPDKNGKPVVKIIAYENGKQLSEEDAKKLYEKMQKNQAQQSLYFQQMFFNTNRMLEENFRAMNQWWNSEFSTFHLEAPKVETPPPSTKNDGTSADHQQKK